jgi:endonuclease/exonuclease/phosphatase family metal-dependent hydrolase
MNGKFKLVLVFSILFLFLIQSAGMLVESIYILALLKTSLDAKVLGILFFFSPVVLLLFGKRSPAWFTWLAFALLLIGRGSAPYLNTDQRMLASGVGTGAALLLFPILITSLKKNRRNLLLAPAQGLALAVVLSILLRTINASIDYSLTAQGGWIGWVLGVILAYLLAQFLAQPGPEAEASNQKVTVSLAGSMAIITLMYFTFASPAVIVRWTHANYFLVVTGAAGFTVLWLWFSLRSPGFLANIKPSILLAWNLLFALALTGTILAHTLQFPANPSSPAVVVSAPSWYQQIPLALMLILFPVLFFDFAIFSAAVSHANLAPRRLAPGMLLGSLLLALSVFMNIFSNVWGYVEPISPFFRNKFWLPFLLLAGAVTLVIFLLRKNLPFFASRPADKFPTLVPGAILCALPIVIGIYAYLTDRVPTAAPEKTSLTVMTYNIQQGNNQFGEKSIDQQLELIRQVNPDILGLQESDSARISLNNNDIPRYFAAQLGYHVYYGPKTVTGTYGTALLSRYPLENPRTFFTYSDQDEIGTVQAEILVGGQRLAIFNVHPDGSDQAMMTFAETLLQRAASYSLVISIGDYNLRNNEAVYQIIDAVYKNAWMGRYPSGVSSDGLDMSGTKRIDHIFVSPQVTVTDAVYVLAPASHTDHPVHWAVISWAP